MTEEIIEPTSEETEQPEPLPVDVYAVIENSMVVNVIVWDGVEEYNPGDGFELVKIDEGVFAGIGFEWNGTDFIDVRPEPEPEDE